MSQSSPIRPHDRNNTFEMNESLAGTMNFDDLSDLTASSSLGTFTYLPQATYMSNVIPPVNGQHIWGFVKGPHDPPWNPNLANNGIPLTNAGGRSDFLNGVSGQNHLSSSMLSVGDRRELLSECDTAVDSAYYTASVRRSIASSAHGDGEQHTDAQRLALPMDRSPSQDTLFEPSAVQQRQQISYDVSQVPQTVSSSNRSAPMGTRCPDCGVDVKNKSQLKKHQARHTKPNRCDVPGCLRKDGFSTWNDLDRHKRTVHKQHSNAEIYRCPYGSCLQKKKPWPRADNFKSHLVKVHRMNKEEITENELRSYIVCPNPSLSNGVSTSNISDDISQVPRALPSSIMAVESAYGADPDSNLRIMPANLYQAGPTVAADCSNAAESSSRQSDTLLTSFVGSKGSTAVSGTSTEIISQDRDADFGDLMDDNSDSPSKVAADRTTSMVQDQSMVPLSYPLSDGEREHARQCSTSPTSSLGRPGSPPAWMPDVDHSSAENRKTALLAEPNLAPRASPSSNPATPSSPDAGQPLLDGSISATTCNRVELLGTDNVKAYMRALEEAGRLQDLMTTLGYQITKVNIEQPKKLPAKPARTVGSRIPCTEEGCEKTFQRPCELKKHTKRHDRPYGCTFAKCRKKFGSKNDWKRHETSQHFQLEVWKCSEPKVSNPSEKCGNSSHHRAPFKKHLMNEHGRLEGDELDGLLEKYHLGRNCESRFWCGFCEDILDVKQTGLTAWKERYDHIDNHITGQGAPRMSMSQWKMIDPQQSKVDVSDSSGDEVSDRDPRSSRTVQVFGQKRRFTGPVATSAGPPLKRSRVDHLKNSESRVERGDTWYCCSCNIYWDTATAMECPDSSCRHRRCEGCLVDDHSLIDRSPR